MRVLLRWMMALGAAALLAGCSTGPEQLAKLAPFGQAPREACGETTQGVSFEDLDDGVEDWTIQDATEELGPAPLADVVGGIKRAGWYDIHLGQVNCGTLLIIMERGEQNIVTVRDLSASEIWEVLGGRFPR